MKHQTPSESPTEAGDHRGVVLGISPHHPSIEEPLMMIVMMKIMKRRKVMKMMMLMMSLLYRGVQIEAGYRQAI